MITRHYVNLTERGLATDRAEGSAQSTIDLNYCDVCVTVHHI